MSLIFLFFPSIFHMAAETGEGISIYSDKNWYRGRQNLALLGIDGFFPPPFLGSGQDRPSRPSSLGDPMWPH